ncbi:MAG: hypothetical protein EXX96DRAFT_488212 [Benjaminiella poitrasii]|nr:MAG: hypothetical protein EXX96DRAFT_488212 [Benjaminiella poitrasii]
MLQRVEKENKRFGSKKYYYGAVWTTKGNEDFLVFAIFAQHNNFLYASNLFIKDNEQQRKEAIDLLVEDILASSIKIIGLHAFQPVLRQLRNTFEAYTDIKFEKNIQVWSFILKKGGLTWTPKAKTIAEAKETKLRVATVDDFPILRTWANAFIKDVFKDSKSAISDSLETICHDMVESRALYFLCVNDIPVSMAWKVRPFYYGCSLSFVYTPPEHRHRGYGIACVSMASEAILNEEKNEYITLFVDMDQSRSDNLYSRVGYKYFGESGRFVCQQKITANQR